MAHPRLYWGDVGNNLTPALARVADQPQSPARRLGGGAAFFDAPGSPVSANRTYDIFNQNGWGRSLHFLAAWFARRARRWSTCWPAWPAATSAVICALAAASSPRGVVWAGCGPITCACRFRRRPAGPATACCRSAPTAGRLRRAAAGGADRPGDVAGGYRRLSVPARLFGGFQSARTIHFFAFVALVLFVVVHVAMVVKSGFRRQMRAMTVGRLNMKPIDVARRGNRHRPGIGGRLPRSTRKLGELPPTYGHISAHGRQPDLRGASRAVARPVAGAGIQPRGHHARSRPSAPPSPADAGTFRLSEAYARLHARRVCRLAAVDRGPRRQARHLTRWPT